MFLSVFELFKIGIGPSSSHTVGPMVAARRFIDGLRRLDGAPAHVTATLHGSLAFTGKGHGTDRAVVLGLLGEQPETIDPDRVDEMIYDTKAAKRLTPEGLAPIAFDPDADIVFDYGPPLPGHANGMVFRAFDAAGATLAEEVFYSVGGGFVVTAAELDAVADDDSPLTSVVAAPYPFASAREMLEMGEKSGLSIADMKRANELVAHKVENLDAGLDAIWDAMNGSMERGLAVGGRLPGGLNVARRAREIHQKLTSERGRNDPFQHTVMDWLSVYAMAVNEENAAGGKVVTAPTNGAAGIIPAVIRYYVDHCPHGCREGVRTFLLTAAAIGGIIKHNASISGAEVGCQGEVGSASAMAAAGLASVLGGTNAQIENAAEIALEHHLGMTCDPIGGLVQVPCIERNGLGAVKAVTAASLSLRGDGTHFVQLDECIETMRQTGLDMNEKYKETATGGLASNVIEC
ncbi:L-serine ammonia-lyase [Rhodobium gokarnense]|uniref:L-serine dehydratase n=1 Tax=Rhodobium gokarnense TaxID=364296 RepID=A0ABT3HA15_9HYPH|nr:L-serine ammonia-lyase [Rhodobium gokarnense]MCW2307243.1 L-serine dehydratase [Rhodobium gokarnense]